MRLILLALALSACLTTQLVAAKDELQNLMLCSGASLTKDDFVGTCLDGNFLYMSGDDCSKDCKCTDDGKLSCKHAADCATDSQVNDYCKSNANFHCYCLTQANHVDSRSSKEDVVELPAVNYEPVVTTKKPAQASHNTATVWFPPVRDIISGEIQSNTDTSQHIGHGTPTVNLGDQSTMSVFDPRRSHTIYTSPPSIYHTSAIGSRLSLDKIHPPRPGEPDSLVAVTPEAGLPEMDFSVPMTTLYLENITQFSMQGATVLPVVLVPTSNAAEKISTLSKIGVPIVTPYTLFSMTSVDTTVYAMKAIPTGADIEAAVIDSKCMPAVVNAMSANGFTQLTPTTFLTFKPTVPKATALALRSAKECPITCDGSDMNKIFYMNTCPSSFFVSLNGYYCKSRCKCNDSGNVECQGQDNDGSACCGGDSAFTDFCTNGEHPEFNCFCGKGTSVEGSSG